MLLTRHLVRQAVLAASAWPHKRDERGECGRGAR